MNVRAAWILSLSIVFAPAAWATDVQTVVTQEEAAAPATYDVFIDGVTGYAFVKTPAGWKFIRSLREEPAPKANITQQ